MNSLTVILLILVGTVVQSRKGVVRTKDRHAKVGPSNMNDMEREMPDMFRQEKLQFNYPDNLDVFNRLISIQRPVNATTHFVFSLKHGLNHCNMSLRFNLSQEELVNHPTKHPQMKIHKPSKGRNMARKNKKTKPSTINPNPTTTTTSTTETDIDTVNTVDTTNTTDTVNANTVDTTNTTSSETVNANTETVTATSSGTKNENKDDEDDNDDEDEIEDILDEYEYEDDIEDESEQPREGKKKNKVSEGSVWIRVTDPKGHELAHSSGLIDLVLKDSGDYGFEIGGDYGEGLAVDIDLASVGCHQVSHKMTDVDFAIFLNRFQLNGVRQSVS